LRDLLERIYREQRQGLYSLALSITRHAHQAEDAVHEAFARLCRKTGAPHGDAASYVFAAVRNAALDQVRRRRADAPTPDGLFDMEGREDGDPVLRASEAERDELLRAALDELPERQREVVVMRIYGGLTFEQMSQALDEPLSTVSSRYRRALDQLRKSVETFV